MPKAIRSLFQGILAASLLTAAQALSAQSGVSLHIRPDIDAPVYTTAELSVLDRYNPQPIISENFVGQGWETILYRGNYVGYVRSNTLAGDYVRPGTTVYMGPTEQSPAMQTLQAARQAYLKERINNEWSQVVFNGVMPLYFMRNTGLAQDSVNLNDPALDANISRTHIGRFERVTAMTRLLGGNHQYQLADAQGKVIAFVDINNALFVGRIEDYWGKMVTIEGPSRDRPGSVPIVIDARFLGLR